MFCVAQMICKRNSLITCLQTQKEFRQRLIEGKAISRYFKLFQRERTIEKKKIDKRT